MKSVAKLSRSEREELFIATAREVRVLRFAVNDELIYAVGGCVKNSLPKIFEVYETE